MTRVARRHSSLTSRTRTVSRSFHIPRITSTARQQPRSRSGHSRRRGFRAAGSTSMTSSSEARPMNWRDAGRWRCHDIERRSVITRIVSNCSRRRGGSPCRSGGPMREPRRRSRASAGSSERSPATRRISKCSTYLGVALASAGRPADARRLLESSQRFRTTSVASSLELARLLARQGNIDASTPATQTGERRTRHARRFRVRLKPPCCAVAVISKKRASSRERFERSIPPAASFDTS